MADGQFLYFVPTRMVVKNVSAHFAFGWARGYPVEVLDLFKPLPYTIIVAIGNRAKRLVRRIDFSTWLWISFAFENKEIVLGLSIVA